jgi:hypothetical protein
MASEKNYLGGFKKKKVVYHIALGEGHRRKRML